MKNTTIIASLFTSLVVLSGCTDPKNATRALESAGYKDIQIEGYSFFGCGDSDTYRTEFSAVGGNGEPVEGVVCAGIFKGQTIRIQ